MSVLTIHIDGAARGNPGPAACAYVITRDSAPLVEEGEHLGSTTNNIAEYTALVRALERAAQLGGQRLVIRSDSELLVKQMNGQYRVKNEQLRELYDEAKRLCAPFESVAITHVPRSANSVADRLCNEVLDGLWPGTPSPLPLAPAAGARGRGEGVPVKEPPQRGNVGTDDRVRQEALHCLRDAIAAWTRDVATAPSPEEIWDQLWSILEEGGVLRSPPAAKARRPASAERTGRRSDRPT